MITFWGKLYKGDKLLKSETFDCENKKMADALLECIEHFSKSFDIGAPMWHSAHTKQMGVFKKATFRPDDFIDHFEYDKFEIQLIDKA